MRLKIFVDSSSGISLDEANELGIEIIPLRILFNDQEYLDGVNLSKEEFYHKLINEKEFPKTSLPNLFEIEKKVNKYLQENYNIIILPLSKEISGTFSSLKSMFENESQVRVIDTNTTINGLRYLVMRAKELENETLDVIANELDSLQKKIRILAGIDTLEYLSKGGRISKTISTIGDFVGLKPLISVIDGKVEVLCKRHGKKKAMKYIVDKLVNAQIDFNYPIYGIYSHVKENFIDLFNMITNQEIKDHIMKIENIAPVIGCHIGPNAYGITYIEKEK